jgi:predicted ribosome-associated RNA-binding protein Tma20
MVSGDGARTSRLCGGVVRRTKNSESSQRIRLMKKKKGDAYMDAGTVMVVSVGADAMGAPGVTIVATVVVG